LHQRLYLDLRRGSDRLSIMLRGWITTNLDMNVPRELENMLQNVWWNDTRNLEHINDTKTGMRLKRDDESQCTSELSKKILNIAVLVTDTTLDNLNLQASMLPLMLQVKFDRSELPLIR
jgi:hypothetical protein